MFDTLDVVFCMVVIAIYLFGSYQAYQLGVLSERRRDREKKFKEWGMNS